MAALTEKDLSEITTVMTAVRGLEGIAAEAIKFIDSNGDYIGQIKYDQHNGYMFLMPGDPDEDPYDPYG